MGILKEALSTDFENNFLPRPSNSTERVATTKEFGSYINALGPFTFPGYSEWSATAKECIAAIIVDAAVRDVPYYNRYFSPILQVYSSSTLTRSSDKVHTEIPLKTTGAPITQNFKTWRPECDFRVSSGSSIRINGSLFCYLLGETESKGLLEQTAESVLSLAYLKN